VRKGLVPPATSNSLNALSYVLFVLSGFAVAGAVQELYEKTFDVPGRGLKDTPRRLIWLLVLTAATAFSGWAGPWLHDSGGPSCSAWSCWSSPPASGGCRCGCCSAGA